MLYFKNVELAEKYQVSLGTVRNWIESSLEGKLDLSLILKKDRHYIINNQENVAKIERVVEMNRKFRNSNAVKKITPKSSFYKIFSEEQVYDIASTLEIHHEIPLQYSYFNGGAKAWNDYTKYLASSDTENSFNAAQKLLKDSLSYLDALIGDYDRVNVIDIGPGNAMPARALLTHLSKGNKLGRYIALDISPSMIEIAKKNIFKWFGNDFPFEGYIRNIEHDRFSDLLIHEYVKKNNKRIVNIVLHLGYTLRNMQDPENGYRTIHASIGKDDLLIEDNLLDTVNTRNYFDFEDSAASVSPIPDLLNLDQSYFEDELGFDTQNWERYERIRFKFAIEFNFKFKSGSRSLTFNKGESVLMWRNIHYSVENLLQERDHTGFTPIYLCKTDSSEYMLTFFKVKVS